MAAFVPHHSISTRSSSSLSTAKDPSSSQDSFSKEEINTLEEQGRGEGDFGRKRNREGEDGRDWKLEETGRERTLLAPGETEAQASRLVSSGTELNSIWQMTSNYLSGLNQFCSKSGHSLTSLSSSLIRQYKSLNPHSVQQLSFLLQALEIANNSPFLFQAHSEPAAHVTPSTVPPCISGNPGLSARGGSPRSVQSYIADNSPVSKSNPQRKPTTFLCSLCQSESSSKKALIRHFQTDHGVGHSQSFIYKSPKLEGEQATDADLMEKGQKK